MVEAIITSLITAGFGLIGTIIAVAGSARKTNNKIEVTQAITDTKLEELTREVREHNGFAQRMPVIEEKIDNLEKRVEKLEEK